MLKTSRIRAPKMGFAIIFACCLIIEVILASYIRFSLGYIFLVENFHLQKDSSVFVLKDSVRLVVNVFLIVRSKF